MHQYRNMLLFLTCIAVQYIACNRASNSAESEEHAIYSMVIDAMTDSAQCRFVFVSDSTLVIHPPVRYKYSGSTKVAIFDEPGPGVYAPRVTDHLNDAWPDLHIEDFRPSFEQTNSVAHVLSVDSIRSKLPLRIWHHDSSSSGTVASG
jgi:hypothetical protein